MFKAIYELLDLVRDGNIMANGVFEGSHIVVRYCELFFALLVRIALISKEAE